MFRNLGFITYRLGGGKERNINKFWQIDEDKEVVKKKFGDTEEEVRETIARIKAAHKIK